MLKVGIWVESFRCAGILIFAMARWKFSASTIFEILPLSTRLHCASKNLYLQRYSTDFRNLCLRSKMLRVGIWVGSVSCAGILVLQWQAENVAHRHHLKFPTSNLFTVTAKILYLQRYSNDFRKLCFSSKMLKVGIWAECFSCADILLLQWQGENFAHRQHLKFCHFQQEQCASKNPISPKVFNRFSKSLPQLEDVGGGHLGGKCQLRRYFSFAMARWKHCASTTFKVLPLSNCTVCQQKSCIPKGIQPIFEIVASARRCWGWAFGWKVSAAQVF